MNISQKYADQTRTNPGRKKSERKSTPAIKHEKATKTVLGTKGADRPKQTQAAKVLDAPIGFTVDLLSLSHALL